ncbi:MAG: HEAT repeat protein [Candidatus Omnitrophota bacterium]|jgi:HEAT repeat protein
MKPFVSFCVLSCFLLPYLVFAEERPVSDEQLAAIQSGGGFEEVSRPVNLPDLTRGDRLPGGKSGPQKWNLGPSGIVALMVGGFKGDQLQVVATLKGSPAEGKFLKGDVLIGMNGKKFVAGEHLGHRIGKAIVEAEKKENGGRLSFQVWRDKNLVARSGPKDVVNVDIEEMFSEARDDNSLYEWKPEEAREREALGFDTFPIDGTNLVADLTLRVLPSYSDTAPYDCPKTEQILEEAWKVLEQKFVADPNKRRSGRGGVLEAFALVASGKPEHRELVHKWVRSKHSPWHPPTEPIGAMFEPGYKGYKGYQSWHKGFGGLYCALYYEATGDDYVLPALRKYAVETAMGQSGGGSWGHTFAYPSFNGGKFHYMNPGYGALNAAGNRCFFLIVLAKKLGVEHPEIDAAIYRAHRYFGSYVDQGGIPYGDFPAYATDDSNGKNTGIAFGMKLLGDKHGAKFFAMMSSHCAFTRRGGHGHDYHGNWSSWAATMCGPDVRIMNERNLRWRRTLCRLHDGRFVYHSPTIEHKTLRDPTATEILHQAVYLKQTLITGKDADEELYPTEKEMEQLLASAQPQLNDPMLIERAGTPWRERNTDGLFELLNIFKPKARGQVATELSKRYQAGEKEILPRLAKLLDHEDARMREGACRGLLACGNDAALQYQSKIITLLDAPEEFVRISAVKALGEITTSKESQVAILKATTKDFEHMGASPNNLGYYAQSVLFKGDHSLANAPFDAGFDEELVQQALEKLLVLDPMGNRPFVSTRKGVWSKDTVIRLAGPLMDIAENEQIVDQMFNARRQAALSVLMPFGYAETVEASASYLQKLNALPRGIRAKVGFKQNLLDPKLVKQQPGAFKALLPAMKYWVADKPLAQVIEVVGDKKVPIDVTYFIDLIEAAPAASPAESLAKDVEQWFVTTAHPGWPSDALTHCRTVLKDPSRHLTFRQMTALSQLVEVLGVDIVEEGGVEDLVRFVGHPNPRLQAHARALVAGLTGPSIAPALAKALGSADVDVETACGILAVLQTRGEVEALTSARTALAHADAKVRGEAIQTVFALGGNAALIDVFKQLRAASEATELNGCEKALLSRRDDVAHVEKTIGACIALLPKSEGPMRESLYWVLAQLGGVKALAALDAAALQAVDDAVFGQIINALSYSPDREADQILIKLMRAQPDRAKQIAAHCTRRLLIGPEGVYTVTDTEKMDFAGPVLKMVLDDSIIKFLGRVHTGRSILALQDAMKRGSTTTATKSIIACAEGMAKAPIADREFAADALQGVIEYIEVTQLRGGPEAHDYRFYPGWKTTSERAGRALLKVFKPEKAPLPEFDDLDLDL